MSNVLPSGNRGLSNLRGVDLEQLRIQLNRNPNLLETYPKLRIGTQMPTSEFYQLMSRLIADLRLNPALKNVDLTQDDLRNANLSGANLPNNIDFSNKNLEGVNFEYINMIGAKFIENDTLNGVIFNFADLSGAVFTDADVSESDFFYANLTGVNFSGAFMNTTFLSSANMTGANISNVNLEEANVDGANFQDIIYNDLTEVPGFRYGLEFANNVPEALIVLSQRRDRERRAANNYQEEEVPARQGVAYEIHNIFNKIDKDQYYDILMDAMPHPVDLTIQDIDVYFQKVIRDHFPANEQPTAIQKLEAIMRRLRSSGELSEHETQRLISSTANFVMEQPVEFQIQYMKMFIQDCYSAYADTLGNPLQGEQGMSCPRGIVERFVMLIGDTVQIICSDPESTNCTPIYRRLIDVFSKKELDINKFTQEWDEEFLQKPEFQDKTRMTKAQIKASFIDFMKRKYEEVNMWIPSTQELVNKRADELDYAFEQRMFGGRQRNQRNRRRKKTARKYRKTQNKKKPRKRTIKKARKNVTKKR